MGNLERQDAISFADFFVTKFSLITGEQIHKAIGESMQTNITTRIEVDQNDKHLYAVNFQVSLANIQTGFALEVEAIAFFRSTEIINESFLQSPFVKLNSPAIAFPFLRSYITTVTANAGYNAIVLPPINFAATVDSVKTEDKE